ncbi:MAG: hypothetical protein ABSF68_03560 [Candidatus Acidiferrales bacterium]
MQARFSPCLLKKAASKIVLLPPTQWNATVSIMGAPLATQKEKQNWITDPGRRRSMRVLLSVPISVSGKTVQNQDFSEETRTLVVNAHGALISLAAPVVANQTIFVSNNATQETEECRIVYLGNTQAGKAQMGVEFLSPSPSFWQIDFPPEDWIMPEN